MISVVAPATTIITAVDKGTAIDKGIFLFLFDVFNLIISL